MTEVCEMVPPLEDPIDWLTTKIKESRYRRETPTKIYLSDAMTKRVEENMHRWAFYVFPTQADARVKAIMGVPYETDEALLGESYRYQHL